MAHHHSHSNHHTHRHDHNIGSLNRVFIISIALNIIFVAIEAAVGFCENSLGLLSDAGHNLGDVFSLLLALIAFRLAKIKPSSRHTYGYKKSTILISLVNALILLVAVGLIVIESVHKFSVPTPVNGEAVSWTAGAGIVINGLTAYLLMRQQGDLNVRGAFLHMAADTLVSLGVVVSGFVITATGWTVIDPVISLLISAVILISTWKLLSESINLSLDGVPSSIEQEDVGNILKSLPHVKDAHHIHIWAISTTETALTAHLVLDDIKFMEEVKYNAREHLKSKGISHCTLEVEPSDSRCQDKSCNATD